MRRFAVIFMALVCASFSHADDAKKEQAKAELLAAFEKSSIQKEGSPPFQLKANFTLTFDQPVSGTYKLYWMSPSVWREEIDMPGYQERIVQNGDRKWVSRSTGYPPLRVQELKGLLDLAADPGRDVKDDIDIVRVKEDRGRGLRCLTTSEQGTNPKHRVRGLDCIDTRLGVLAKLTPEDKPEDGNHFSNYADFGTKAYPRTLQHVSNGKAVVQVNDVELTSTAAREGLFLGLPLVEPVPSCALPSHPVPVSTADPTYSDVARQKMVNGTATLFVTLSASGTVTDAQVVQTIEPSLDRNAIEAVKRWKFKPAMCGSMPVPAEFDVEITFHIER